MFVFGLIEVAFRLFSAGGSASDPYINISPFMMFTRERVDGEDLKDVAMIFFRKAQREALELRKDPAKFAKVKSHYATSIEYMAGEAESRGIPLLLFTVPTVSSIRHCDGYPRHETLWSWWTWRRNSSMCPSGVVPALIFFSTTFTRTNGATS